MKITKHKRIPPGAICNRCGSTEDLTKDHIIPQQIFTSLCLPCNDSENLQVLCGGCNKLKGSKLDPKNKKTLPLLKMYVSRWERLFSPERKRNVHHTYRELDVKSLTPNTYYFTDNKSALESIYKKQHCS